MKSCFRLSYVCNLVLRFSIEIISTILLSTHFLTVARHVLNNSLLNHGSQFGRLYCINNIYSLNIGDKCSEE